MARKATGKPVIGILGGVGSGKSTAAAEFERLGCRRIDADAIGHTVLDDPRVQSAIRTRWGSSVFGADGRVDRGALAAAVFEDASALADLSAITHPPIVARIDAEIAAAQEDASCEAVVLDAPVLIEAGLADRCTHKVFVRSSPEVRSQRVVAGRGWSVAQWEKREESQIPLDTKAAMCDYTVENGSTVSCLLQQVRELFDTIVHATRPS